MAREIPLTRGYVAVVDDEDFDRVSARSWFAKGRKYVYAVSAPRAHESVSAQLGRFILSPPPGMVVDHINGDPLDNRRANLRICTQRQNLWNKPCWSKSGFKGVYRHGPRWRAECKGRKLGSFDTPEQAARAYDAAALLAYGEFARLNFPETTEAA